MLKKTFLILLAMLSILLFSSQITHAAVLTKVFKNEASFIIDLNKTSNVDYSTHVFSEGDTLPPFEDYSDTIRTIHCVLDLNADGQLDYITKYETEEYEVKYGILLRIKDSLFYYIYLGPSDSDVELAVVYDSNMNTYICNYYILDAANSLVWDSLSEHMTPKLNVGYMKCRCHHVNGNGETYNFYDTVFTFDELKAVGNICPAPVLP